MKTTWPSAHSSFTRYLLVIQTRSLILKLLMFFLDLVVATDGRLPQILVERATLSVYSI